ncbi:MAG: DoxX family protein [Gammaproteobacteria bacterium]
MANPFVNDDLGKLILRLSLGILLLFHGVGKLLNIDGSLQFIGGMLTNLNLPMEIAYGVFLGEVIAPVLIIIGLFTRLGGLLIAGNMVFAIVLVHTAELFAMTQNGGWALELQGMYLFGGLALLFMGGGKIAVRPD